MTENDLARTLEDWNIARVCHEATRALQQTLGEDPVPVWGATTEWMRTSTHESVRAIMNGATPAELHKDWCAAKEADGWVYGNVKDAEAKTHPDLRPWEDLSATAVRKDMLFVSIVQALARPTPR